MQEAAVDFASDLKKKEKKENKRVYTGGVRPTSHIGQQKSGVTSQQGWKGKGEKASKEVKGRGIPASRAPGHLPSHLAL